MLEQALVTNMICAPSRASLWTGRYPRCHGGVTNGVLLPDDEITLASALLDEGYRTAAIGALHLSPCQDSVENDTPESRRYHKSGKPLPSPYHGFQDARLVASHTNDWGDYHNTGT